MKRLLSLLLLGGMAAGLWLLLRRAADSPLDADLWADDDDWSETSDYDARLDELLATKK